MHPERFIMEINVVQNDISDDLYFDYKTVHDRIIFHGTLWYFDGTCNITATALKWTPIFRHLE